jgi:hypothetical protein
MAPLLTNMLSALLAYNTAGGINTSSGQHLHLAPPTSFNTWHYAHSALKMQRSRAQELRLAPGTRTVSKHKPAGHPAALYCMPRPRLAASAAGHVTAGGASMQHQTPVATRACTPHMGHAAPQPRHRTLHHPTHMHTCLCPSRTTSLHLAPPHLLLTSEAAHARIHSLTGNGAPWAPQPGPAQPPMH